MRKIFIVVYTIMIFHDCVANNYGNCFNNSGLWTDYKITTVEDQVKFTVPMNPDTATLFYNHRMLVDNKGAIEPRAWLISKLNRISPDGIVHVTLAQDIFDQHKDYIERDESGNVIGMWADYYVNQLGATDKEVAPDSDTPVEYTSTISYSGVKPELKVGGSFKTFTMQYFDGAGNLADHPCSWNYKFIDDDINPEDVLRIITAQDSEDLADNQVKIKFVGSEEYYGEILTIYNEYTSIDIAIVGM